MYKIYENFQGKFIILKMYTVNTFANICRELRSVGMLQNIEENL